MSIFSVKKSTESYHLAALISENKKGRYIYPKFSSNSLDNVKKYEFVSALKKENVDFYVDDKSNNVVIEMQRGPKGDTPKITDKRKLTLYFNKDGDCLQLKSESCIKNKDGLAARVVTLNTPKELYWSSLFTRDTAGYPTPVELIETQGGKVITHQKGVIAEYDDKADKVIVNPVNVYDEEAGKCVTKAESEL